MQGKLSMNCVNIKVKAQLLRKTVRYKIVFELMVPSKTFLLGEYVALKGSCPVLVLTTEKYFKLFVGLNSAQKIDVQGIHMESPAGKLIKSNVDFYKNYAIKFIDPYPSLGGFGEVNCTIYYGYGTE